MGEELSPRRRKIKSLLVWVAGPVTLVAVLGICACQEDYRAKATYAWVKTRGRIIMSSYQYGGGSIPEEGYSFIPDVSYEYFVRDTVFRSHGPSGRGGRVYFYEISFASVPQVNEYLKQFPPGKIVDVYYSPEDPSEAVLIPESTPGKGWTYWLKYLFVKLASTIVAMVVLGILIVVLIGVLRIFGWRTDRNLNVTRQ